MMTCHTVYTLAATCTTPGTERISESQDPRHAPVYIVIFITSYSTFFIPKPSLSFNNLITVESAPLFPPHGPNLSPY